MVKTEMYHKEVKQFETNEPKHFSISYSFHNSKGEYQERSVKLVAFSLGDAKERIQASIGERECTIMTHDSGQPIHGFTQPVVRLLIKRNLPWYKQELAQSALVEKRDKMLSAQSAKITIGVEQAQKIKQGFN